MSDAYHAVDEAPYRRYAAADGDLVMVAAATYSAFSSRPAAFSRSLVTGELRHRLGYRGIVMTDALDTVSVRAFGSPAETALAAVRAGCDLLLFTEPGPGRQPGARSLVSCEIASSTRELSKSRQAHSGSAQQPVRSNVKGREAGTWNRPRLQPLARLTIYMSV